MNFVIPTIYKAIDQYTRPVRSYANETVAFANKAAAANARLERGMRKVSSIASDVAVNTGIAAAAILTPLSLAVNSAMKFEDRMADVGKTTGLADSELLAFGKGIRSLSRTTRTSIDDLASIGEIGGQLGVAKNELLSFVAASDKFNIALGKDYAGGVEEAISSVSKLKSLYKDTRGLAISDAIMRTGSAINDLGAMGNGTSQNINDFMLRVGALPDALKPSITSTAALGAFFEEAGINSEIASGGFSNFLLVAGKNLAGFAAQMHVSQQAASLLLQTDPTEFAKRFSTSINGLAPDRLANKLHDLKLNSQETIKVIGALGANTQQLTNYQIKATEAFTAGSSLAAEAARKNETFAAKVYKAKNIIVDLTIAVGEKLIPVLSSMIDKVAPVVSSVVDWVNKNESLVSGFVTAAGYIGGFLAAVSGISTAIAIVTKATWLWKSAQVMLNLVFMANPIGFVIRLVIFLATIIKVVSNHTDGWGKQWNATVSWMGAVFDSWYLNLKLQFMGLYNGFRGMVDDIVEAWKWGQNKLGFLSDEQYKKDLAMIEAQKNARIAANNQTLAAFASAQQKAAQGPGWHVTWKDDKKNVVSPEETDAPAPALMSTNQVQQNTFMQSMQMEHTGAKQLIEILVKDSNGNTEIGKNTGGIPIKVTPNLGTWTKR
jgi:TP901 family phage tail tape measure protein